MKIAIMQPYSFPYIGYFQLINAVDTFVFYDDVNFIKKGFINRNNVLINNQRRRFTIPCEKVSQNKLINQININFTEKIKFLKTIELAYKKAPYFPEFFPEFSKFIFSNNNNKISEFAIESVKFICNYLSINKNFLISSEKFGNTELLKKEHRLIEISKIEKASMYVNSIGGKVLYTKDSFLDKGINLKFIKSKDIKYKQFSNDFIPNLSIIDVLMFNSIEKVLQYLNDYYLVDLCEK